MVIASQPGTAEEWSALAEKVRAPLAAEWEARAPSGAAEVLDFYRETEHMDDDLDAFHMHPDRQSWTDAFISIANQAKPNLTIDIGCGAGHDLRALRAAGIADVRGVEPNKKFRADLAMDDLVVYEDIESTPIEEADLLGCFDVLEHVVGPEVWLGNIARRAKIGCLLMETCATFDIGTPLHLRENRGWKPGHALEAAGWLKVGEQGRLRVWQRMQEHAGTQTALLICAYRSISLPTVASILKLLDDPKNPLGWRVSLNGEAGINRSRSIIASRWWAETADDVFLMLDDDIIFSPEDAHRLVELCRNGHDIVCAAYPVRDGGHVALRGYGKEPFTFGGGLDPVEIRYASTGFLAVHRRVLDALIQKLPLCHANQQWSFWPLFDFKTIEDEPAGGHNYLSEDWNFCDMALDAGFKVWLDPSIRIQHLGMVPIHVGNMGAVHALF